MNAHRTNALLTAIAPRMSSNDKWLHAGIAISWNCAAEQNENGIRSMTPEWRQSAINQWSAAVRNGFVCC